MRLLKIGEVAQVIRSKNAGPYELVLDIIFKDKAVYEILRKTAQISGSRIAGLYGISPDEVHRIVWFEPANAVKAVLKRRVVSGAPGDTDVYGAQQHAPLLSLTFEI